LLFRFSDGFLNSAQISPLFVGGLFWGPFFLLLRNRGRYVCYVLPVVVVVVVVVLVVVVDNIYNTNHKLSDRQLAFVYNYI